jgi:tetratricopeptide (TPR) repeat protein
LAVPGSVIVGEATEAAVAHAIDSETLGALEIRGRQGAVEAYRVTGLRSSRTSGRGLGRRVVSIGRAPERRRLEAAVDAVASRRGGVAFVLGDAGIGKSRLLDDLAEYTRVSHPGVQWLQAAALSFEEMVAYALARRLLHAAGGVGSDRLLRHLDRASDSRRRLVLDVLGAVGSEVAVEADQVTGDSVSLAFGELLAAIVGDPPAPAVLVLDDLHWADAASTELVGSIFERTERAPVLVVGAARPERSGGSWRLKQLAESEFPHRYVEVQLDPLGPADSQALFEALLAVPDLPRAVVDTIMRRADGNPYFLEEIVRELLETGALASDGAHWRLTTDNLEDRVPQTLRRLLQARFDRLSADGRVTLETAAVVGRVFAESLLESVTGRDVGRDLHELLKVGVVEEHDPATRAFAFRHALAHEAAYESILMRTRRETHRRVGDTIEAEAPDAVESAAVLAHHFAAAGDNARAARYALVAGERAASLGAFADACRHFDRGVALMAASVDEEVAVRLALGRGRSREVLGDIDGAIEDLETALAASRGSGDSRLEWEVHVALGAVWAARDYRRTGEHYRAALAVARASADSRMLGTSLNRLGNWYVNAADPRRGVELHREALGIFESLDEVRGVAESHDLLGMGHAMQGRPAESMVHYEQALSRFRELDDRRGIAGALAGSAIGAPNYEELSMVPTIPVEAALETLDEALGIAVDVGWSAGEAFARLLLCQVLACAGDLGPALRHGELSLEIATAIGHDQWKVGALCALGAAEGDALRPESARRRLTEAREIAWALESRFWILQVAPLLAFTLATLGEVDAAAAALDEALSIPGAEAFMAHRSCLMALAAVQIDQGRPEDALETIAPIEAPGEEVAPGVALIRGRALALTEPTAAAGVIRNGLDVALHWGLRSYAWRLHEALSRQAVDDADDQLKMAREVASECAATLTGQAERQEMLDAIDERLS